MTPNTSYEEELQIACDIVDKLTTRELEFIRDAIDGETERTAFREVYHDDVGEWKEKPEPMFILTNEDAQIVAEDEIGRELTERELHDVSRGVEAGLGEWGEIMRIAINGVTGEG